jgi:hypothetical protein
MRTPLAGSFRPLLAGLISTHDTIGGAGIQRLSPDLLNCIEEAQIRQDWYREYLISEGEQPLDFVGSISLNTNHDIAAKRSERGLVFSLQFGFRSKLGKRR